MRLKRSDERRGIILLVVLALLTLFAIVGLAFVLYSDYEATAARVSREAESQARADVDPEQALAFFLSQLIYDVNDDATGVGSGLRGHSLARTMYGYNYATLGVPGTNNTVPYSGPGRLHYTTTAPPALAAVDDYTLVNYTWFSGDLFVRDPERYGYRGTTLLPGVPPIPQLPAGQTNPYVAANAPYTYPDLNNFFLAAMKADGTVLAPSFHRPWLFNPGQGLNVMDPTKNANWTNLQGKYLTLRPRPAEHPNFPIPDDATGDVKNLPWAPGGNDSIWIDLGAPVMTAPDGTQYKMLFAPLIIDLDGRINLNTAGNILGLSNGHVSNQGWGPWEVNLAKVLFGDATNTEYINLFTGLNFGTYSRNGRYGANSKPAVPGATSAPPTASHTYAQRDWNARNEASTMAPYTPSSRPTPPGYTGGSSYSCFPVFLQGYLNGGTESTDHPSLFDVFRPATFNGTDDEVFRALHLEPLLRPNSTTGTTVDANSSALLSALLQLSPSNFGPNASNARFRNLVTPLSVEIGRPGVIPYWYSTGGVPASPYPSAAYVPPTATAATAPASGSVTFPTLNPIVPPGTGTLPTISNNPGATPPNSSEFGSDWKAVSAALGRIKMNRPLPPYPHMGSGMTPTYSNAVSGYGVSYDMSGSSAASNQIISQYTAAQNARKTLADDLYRRLLMLTGITPVAAPAAPTPAELAPRRWLAQLAVNIVDFIDEDDVSTPFNFYTTSDGLPAASLGSVQPGADDVPGTGLNPTYWVFGTELPKVVLNEALAEATNSTPGIAGTGPDTVNVWLELYNTMSAAAAANAQVQDSYRVPLYMSMPGGGPGYSPYRITLTQNLAPPVPDGTVNVLGKATVSPTTASPLPKTTSDLDVGLAAPAQLMGGGTQAAGTGTANTGVDAGSYFLLGPSPAPGAPYQDPFVVATTATPPNGVPKGTPYYRSPNLQYPTTWTAVTTDERTTGLTVMLRRLANPYLPLNTNPTTTDAMGNVIPNPVYNPYVTVDYISNVPVQNNTPATNTYASRGKRQPYASLSQVPTAGGIPQALPGSPALPASPVQNQTLNAGTPTGVANPANVTHSFGLQNFPLPATGSYDWLVHLDRQVISPMELLHVSGFPPYMLTQQFVVPTVGAGDNNNVANMFKHYVPWLDAPPAGATATSVSTPWWFDFSLGAGNTHRLYRLFEFLECGDRAAGVDGLSRIPGRVNINTVWDPEIFLALVDANSSLGTLSDADVTTLFNTKILPSRTPGGTTLGSTDRPFLPLSIGLVPSNPAAVPVGGQFPNNGINVTQDTILRLGAAAAMPGTTQQLLFQNPNENTSPSAAVPPAGTSSYWHPYLQTQLLNKIYNNVTTRSNCYAVFLTVGFFRVTGTVTGHPNIPQLGEEIGRAEGRQVRHRMFAIIDRTNLSVFSTTSTTAVSGITASTPSGNATITVTLPLSFTNPIVSTLPAASQPSIQVGTQLVIEPGTDNEETVVVTAVAGNSVTANFTKAHPQVAGSTYTVIMRGNPGPMSRYDPRMDPYVVPYFSIID